MDVKGFELKNPRLLKRGLSKRRRSRLTQRAPESDRGSSALLQGVDLDDAAIPLCTGLRYAALGLKVHVNQAKAF